MGYLKRRIIEAMEPKEEPSMEVLGWIPVSERLPEEGVRVLVFDKAFREPEMGTYYAADGWVGDEIAMLNPTHWMPLPPDPVEAA